MSLKLSRNINRPDHPVACLPPGENLITDPGWVEQILWLIVATAATPTTYDVTCDLKIDIPGASPFDFFQVKLYVGTISFSFFTNSPSTLRCFYEVPYPKRIVNGEVLNFSGVVIYNFFIHPE